MSAADTTIVYLYSYFPAIFLAIFFWWMDRFERESILLIVLAFLWGGFGSIVLSFFWNTFFHLALLFYHQDKIANDMMSAVLIAPVVEELTKGILVLFLLKINRVDNITDGLLLGIVIGLGFAATENVYYAQSVIYPASGELAMWDNLWFREIHNTLLHASATGLWGLMIGYSHFFKGVQKFFIILNGYLLAMMTHGLWNFLASFVRHFAEDFPIVEILMRLEVFVIFACLFLIFLLSVKKESGVIVAELCEEAEKGVIPYAHVEFFASLVRHRRRHKLPQQIRPNDYARLGVTLAFRKQRYRYNPSAKLLEEIECLRGKLVNYGKG